MPDRSVKNDPVLASLKARGKELGWTIKFKRRKMATGIKYYFEILALEMPSKVMEEVKHIIPSATMTSGMYGDPKNDRPCHITVAEN